MEKITYPDDVTLFLDESRGTDIPRDFAILINKDLIIDREKWLPELDFLMKYDPYHDFYWETWDQILNHLKIKIGHRTYFFTLQRFPDLSGNWRQNTDFFGADFADSIHEDKGREISIATN